MAVTCLWKLGVNDSEGKAGIAQSTRSIDPRNTAISSANAVIEPSLIALAIRETRNRDKNFYYIVQQLQKKQERKNFVRKSPIPKW